MVKQFITIIKNDMNTVIKSKLLLITIGSLLLYSLYINLVYVNTDIKEYPIYVYDEEESRRIFADSITYVKSEEELYERLNSDKEAVGILGDSAESKIILHNSGDSRIDNSKVLYAKSYFNKNNINIPKEILGTINFKQQKRLEMTSVIVFFEITAISFLSVAALFFKEKQMGVLKVYSILPIYRFLLIFSKITVFMIIEIVFITVLSLININFSFLCKIYFHVILQVLILSPLMILLAFIFSLVYKNFKQFIFAFTIIIVIFTSPVFLFVNTPLNWSGIKYFPTYYLYNNMHNAFFNKLIHNPIYYIYCVSVLVILFYMNMKMINREMVKGEG